MTTNLSEARSEEDLSISIQPRRISASAEMGESTPPICDYAATHMMPRRKVGLGSRKGHAPSLPFYAITLMIGLLLNRPLDQCSASALKNLEGVHSDDSTDAHESSPTLRFPFSEAVQDKGGVMPATEVISSLEHPNQYFSHSAYATIPQIDANLKGNKKNKSAVTHGEDATVRHLDPRQTFRKCSQTIWDSSRNVSQLVHRLKTEKELQEELLGNVELIQSAIVDSYIETRVKHMAAAVGHKVESDLPKPPQYQLYKELAMQVLGPTGKADGGESDSKIPLDRSATKDMKIRPFLPFCVDISLCPSQKANNRMQQYFDITHEHASTMTINRDATSLGESEGKKPIKPTPPGWEPNDEAALSGSDKNFLRFLEGDEKVAAAPPLKDSTSFDWWQDVEMHRRSLRFVRTSSIYHEKEVAAQQKLAEEIAAKNKA